MWIEESSKNSIWYCDGSRIRRTAKQGRDRMAGAASPGATLRITAISVKRTLERQQLLWKSKRHLFISALEVTLMAISH